LGPRVWSQSGPVVRLGVEPENHVHVNPSAALVRVVPQG